MLECSLTMVLGDIKDIVKENVAYTSHEQYFTEHICIDNMNKITGFDGDIDNDGNADAEGDGESAWSSNTRKQWSIGPDGIEEVLVCGVLIDDSMGDTNSLLEAKYDALKALGKG